MPVSITYSYIYNLGTIFDGTDTYPGALPVSFTFTDNRDGVDDNMTADGSQLEFNGSPSTLEALTANGDPVLLIGAIFYAFSNDPNLTGTVGRVDGTNYTYCFAKGTGIATPQGEVAVETLAIGDLVTTACGKTVPVKWLGRQTQHKLVVGPHMQPVRIRAGALGGGVPHSDLVVTADHGMVIDGLVINASALVNGDSIDFVPMAELPDSCTYYHVETEDHDVILANGAPAETFVDAAGRAAFDNHQEYLDLYGIERIIPEMAQPRITAQRLVPDALKQRLGIAVLPEITLSA